MGTKSSTRAFSLLELIAVLAIIAVLATLVLPMLLKNIDKAVSDQEVATLQNFGDAFQRSILRTRTIPLTTWDSAIATELGLNAVDVNQNSRQLPRYLVFDPATTIMLTLPYTQTNLGTTTLADNARAMIISPLANFSWPGFIANGVINSTDFANLWNWPDNTNNPPAGWPSAWNGHWADLKVQRVNLSTLFVKLVLTSYSSTLNSYYAIDGALNNNPITPSYHLEGYFLQNSVLNLYTGDTNTLDSQQVLSRDMGLVYYQNAWRGGITTGTNTIGTNPNTGGLFDFNAIVSSFLAAPQNTAPGAATQTNVVQAYVDYMSNYNAWAASNFTNGGILSATQLARSNMIATIKRLYADPYFPPQGP